MTDMAQTTAAAAVSVHTTPAARKRLKKRYAVETRFKAYGIGAIALASVFLLLLMTTIISQGLPAFRYNYLTLPVNLGPEKVDPGAPQKASYNSIIRDGLKQEVAFVSGRKQRRTLYSLVSAGSNVLLQQQVMQDTALLGTTRDIEVPLSDFADLYVKGLISDKVITQPQSDISLVLDGDVLTLSSLAGEFAVARTALNDYLRVEQAKLQKRLELKKVSLANVESRIGVLQQRIPTAQGSTKPRLEAELQQAEDNRASLQSNNAKLAQEIEAIGKRLADTGSLSRLNADVPSFLVKAGGGIFKLEELDANTAKATILVPMQQPTTSFTAGNWELEKIVLPESSRKFTDREMAYTDFLIEEGRISSGWNTVFFTRGASREPEMAGIWGAVVGSFWTMLVTLGLSFPIGVAAALYLEEFAPKNRWTHLIEVNINNLAAVPSIVFGLLGLAVFLNVFGMPRSAPVAGGMVLALMTLPTIIIASRAAIQAVPPSIREAALGVGASRLQTVFHHVLPLAMPGIFTGTIIGMAQALGETAPLLMIGMVAFIVDIPASPVDPSTVLPVQIFMWADFPEPAFQQKTSAAIMVLLGFLISMNAIAIVLRKRFERRW
ncbi:phosphate ABC transporter permease PstA [Polycladidibacter hongkongensis]|uniref:phosphate ABC transporter permease PstA n=1 Tax=Polycladidibacter hongkongensis TaxID=1647556 RepID=UPI000829F260